MVIAETLALALAAGVLAQMIADRLSVPSIIPLLLAGTLLGPPALGVLHPEALGEGLEILVSFSVAIILFEGSLGLEWGFVRHRGKAIGRLVTVGALVTFVAAGGFAWWLLPVDFATAALLGALVIVTGPTVIRPLLRRVRIQRRVGGILESEGVLIDPIGALIAVVVLEAVLAPSFSFALGPGSFLARLGTGAVVGAVSGVVLAVLLRARFAHEVEVANLAVFAGAIGTFVLSNSLQSESGLMAVVAAGFVVSSFDLPARREILRFKGVLTTIVISLLFILLSADIDWSVLEPIWLDAFLWVASLIFVVRPLNVFLSTWGTDLSIRDRWFLSWISPRGIVAASIASLFGIYLGNEGRAGGELLAPLVFLTIAVTVLLQGLTAGAWARWLRVSADDYGVIIVGASAIGRTLGKALVRRGREVALIDSNPRHCDRAKSMGLAAFPGNCLEAANLERIGIRVADQIVAVTPNNEVNYLACRLAKDEFGVPQALALEHDGDKPVGGPTRESDRIERAFGRVVPEAFHGAFRTPDVLVESRAVDGPGQPLGKLDVGEAVLVIRVHDGRAAVAGENTRFEEGDVVLSVAEPEADWLEPAIPDTEEGSPDG